MEKGFIKADSQNLPKVDMDMVRWLFMGNSNFSNVEINWLKAYPVSGVEVMLLRVYLFMKKSLIYLFCCIFSSMRESYRDNAAIGFNQIKRENQLSIVKGRVIPKYKVCEKGCHVPGISCLDLK